MSESLNLSSCCDPSSGTEAEGRAADCSGTNSSPAVGAIHWPEAEAANNNTGTSRRILTRTAG